MNDVQFQQGDWCVTHPQEILATFFIELPEALSITGSQNYPRYENLIQDDIDRIQESEIAFELGLIQAASQDFLVNDDAFLEGADDWTNKYLFRSSVLFHPVASFNRLVGMMEAPLAVARIASQGMFDPDQVHPIEASNTELRDLVSPGDLAEMVSHGVGAVTVAEVTVPLRLVGKVPSLAAELTLALQDFPELAEFARKLPESVAAPAYVSLKGSHERADYLVRARILSALHLAVSEVRRIQRAYHAVTQHPVTLISRESLAATLPVTIRERRHLGIAGRGTNLVVTVNENYWGIARREDLTDAEHEQLNGEIQKTIPHFMQPYLDFRREADTGFHRRGDTQATAIYCGLAAETFLDRTLLHLMWEEGQRPEAAAIAWRQTITERVRADFAGRIGGIWDTSRPGSVRKWFVSVANLRNRVVHGAYVPTYIEGRQALDATAELVRHVCDGLAKPAVLQKYPRTAFVLMTRASMERRGIYSRRMRELLVDEAETHWPSSFGRWHETFRLVRQDLTGEPRNPAVSRAEAFAVLHDRASIDWVAYDPDTWMAAPIDSESIPRFIVDGVKDGLAKLSSTVIFPVTMGLTGLDNSVLQLTGPWQERYRLLPMAQVMVNRQD